MIRALPWVVVTAVLFARLAHAESEPDPRWLYTVELGGGVEIVGEISSGNVVIPKAGRQSIVTGTVRPLVFFPIGESVQAGGGMIFDGQGYVRGVGGLRLLTGWETWQTKLDLQAEAAFISAFSVGVRVGAGASWLVAPGWRLGADLGGSFLVGHVIAGFDLQATVAYGF